MSYLRKHVGLREGVRRHEGRDTKAPVGYNNLGLVSIGRNSQEYREYFSHATTNHIGEQLCHIPFCGLCMLCKRVMPVPFLDSDIITSPIGVLDMRLDWFLERRPPRKNIKRLIWLGRGTLGKNRIHVGRR